jgi:UDP:flavonoid glycosyltransferase YjiC (YdhE family)
MTIIFDIFPSFGHQHASYKLAKILKEAGHKVFYIGIYKYFRNLPSEFIPIYIYPHIWGFIENHTTSCWMNIKTAFRERKKHDFAKFQEQIINQYDELIEKLKPDVILVDHHYVQKAVFYHKYNIPIISIQTAPASEMDLHIPPFYSSHIPNKSFYSKSYIRYLWYTYLICKQLRFFRNSFFYFGEDHLSMVKRLSKKTGYPIKKYIDFKHYKGYGEFGLKNIPQLLLSPRDFDFPHPLKKNQYAIGPLLSEEMQIKIRDKRYLAVINHIIEEKKRESISFIYCSLGTLNDLGIEKSKKIFQNVIEIGRRNSAYRIVLSVGEIMNPTELLPTPDNVYLFKTLPQKNILKYVDMMIAHGGQNSITECVMNEVPMLIYPFIKTSDLGGNSARVVYHGIGSRGFVKQDSVRDMEIKIHDILSNPIYRKNIYRMKQKFEEKNSSIEAVTIIESIVNEYKRKHLRN